MFVNKTIGNVIPLEKECNPNLSEGLKFIKFLFKKGK